MKCNKRSVAVILSCLLYTVFIIPASAQKGKKFKVIAFFTARNDAAHISFVHEANKWFPKMGQQYGFSYDSTNNWNNLTDTFLAKYQAVIFLDTRPDSLPQREAFKRYMDNGGGWIGFHFSAFALTPSDFPQNWDWYHNDFLGGGEYKGNTWRPTSANLRVESRHAVTKHLPAMFTSAPNEWYSWNNDLKTNPDIQILLSIDSSSFPLGTGPKPYEIWHHGYYPVAWTNKHYKMIYLNVGHNDIDYEHKTNKELSSTFASEFENRFIINSLIWVCSGKKPGMQGFMR